MLVSSQGWSGRARVGTLRQLSGKEASADNMVNTDMGLLEYSAGNAVEGMALTGSSNPKSLVF